MPHECTTIYPPGCDDPRCPRCAQAAKRRGCEEVGAFLVEEFSDEFVATTLGDGDDGDD